jgi:hypothetical protein
MSFKAFALAFTAIGMSACTTVDMTAMGGNSAPVMSQSSEPNVVEKACSRLFALFSSKGWSTHDSRKRMQSAASILLNGLEDKSLSDDPSAYAQNTFTADALSVDIREAENHIQQTVKAAEIFLSMAAPDQDIREELSELEQALLASRQAETVFTEATQTIGAPDADLKRLNATVDSLRNVTDEFGRRVRRAQNRSVAVLAGGALKL